MTTVAAAFAAFAMQYLLLHSHKAGASFWIFVAPVSGVLVLLGLVTIRSMSARHAPARKLSVLSLLSLVLPPATYIGTEWREVPNSVANALAHDPWFYLASTTIVSGGWLFSLLFLWLLSRARKRT